MAGIDFLVKRYRHNPLLFVKEMFNAEPEDEQVQILNSVKANRMTAVKSGHGVGKTTTLAWIVLWFMFTRPFPKIPCTAPTMHQLRDILWAEISKWLAKSPVLNELFDWTVERVALKGQSEKWFAVARTATKPDAMQGFHADSLLFILDEASGINDVIFEPILGALTGEETKLVMVGNPTRTKGFFYNAFTRNRAMFNCITLNAENSNRVSQEFIDAIVALYGKESDPYRVRVLGEFPKSQPDTFISLDLVENSIALYDKWVVNNKAYNHEKELYDIHLGVDVARFGDDESTIWATFEYADRGKIYGGKNYFVSKKELILYKNDTVELAGRVKAIIATLNAKYKNIKVKVNVDETGVGAGVVDILESKHGDLKYEVIAQTFGGTGGRLAEEPIKYSNNTGLLWGNIKRLFIAKRLFIEEDASLISQLTDRKYRVNEDGYIQLERKQDMKKRNVSSPDRADAIALSLGTNISNFSGMLDY